MPSLRRMRLAALVLPAAAALTLAGCSGTTAGSTDGASASASSSGAGFPISITSALGTATIEQKPTRVATVGCCSTRPRASTSRPSQRRAPT